MFIESVLTQVPVHINVFTSLFTFSSLSQLYREYLHNTTIYRQSESACAYIQEVHVNNTCACVS